MTSCSLASANHDEEGRSFLHPQPKDFQPYLASFARSFCSQVILPSVPRNERLSYPLLRRSSCSNIRAPTLSAGPRPFFHAPYW